MTGLVFCIFFALGILVFMEAKEYKIYNPQPKEGVYRVSFDRFLEIYRESGDYITAKPHYASYSAYVRKRFVFSFTYWDWRRYQKWYQDMMKAQKDKENEYFRKQCDELFGNKEEGSK